MNSYTMIYNAPTSARHSFQINGTENSYINSTGITTIGNITAATCNIVDTTGNSLVIGTEKNKWLFNTYTNTSFYNYDHML